MATLALTKEEIRSTRLQFSHRLTETDIPDGIIADNLMVSSATDYVYENVLRDIDVSALPSDEMAFAERIRDATDDNFIGFLDNVLKPPQDSQFRRAVIFRLAGLLVPTIKQVIAESGSDISQRFQTHEWEIVQASLFLRSDEEIELLRNAFPDDAFPDDAGAVRSFKNVTLMRVTGGR